MDSTVFFGEYGEQWKNKKGVYCIENPLFSKELGKGVYKVGYARNSIYTRIGDYRTAYGIIPFKIHCLIEIPAGVFGKRSGYTLLNEQRLHKELTKDNSGAGANEWYFNLNNIVDVMYSLYKELTETIPIAKNWLYYFAEKRTRFHSRVIISEKEIKSKLYDGLIYGSKITRSSSKKGEKMI